MENNAQDKIKIISKPMNEIESKDFDYLQVWQFFKLFE